MMMIKILKKNSKNSYNSKLIQIKLVFTHFMNESDSIEDFIVGLLFGAVIGYILCEFHHS